MVYVDLRGFVEWAASQPWSTGQVGMWGKSYDAWTEVMALDERPQGLAAAVIQAPLIDGYKALYQNGVHYDTGWYGMPALYQEIDAIPPTPFDSPMYFAGWAKGTNSQGRTSTGTTRRTPAGRSAIERGTLRPPWLTYERTEFDPDGWPAAAMNGRTLVRIAPERAAESTVATEMPPPLAPQP